MVDLQKVKVVENSVRPISVTEVRIFMGIDSYYNRFIKNFPSISTRLTDLTKKEVPFEFTEKCEGISKTLRPF